MNRKNLALIILFITVAILGILLSYEYSRTRTNLDLMLDLFSGVEYVDIGEDVDINLLEEAREELVNQGTVQFTNSIEFTSSDGHVYKVIILYDNRKPYIHEIIKSP
ncbi:hypothetical protein FLK61_31395 [Paenalkalicoccus suaedae]|uniref:DUF3139 domain-containing protein n=1 Tax=Paenalkalicoccus suaedae TaxID=2592382 RepID=A0A859FEE3_9BACI|nr:hypothetical protein [Paenalkalicoccus suaedae]QKS71218.1 hypothetical protein FLK61_31395 [Paenalkalicoccus suaedae]